MKPDGTSASAGISADEFASELESSRGRDDSKTTYDQLVMSAVKGAGLVLVVKIAAVLALARFLGATVGLDFWFGIVPHMQFETEPGTFTLIVTLSTLAMAVVALALSAITYVGLLDTSRQKVVGRGVASVIALQTLGLELYRHYTQDATVRWAFAWLIVIAGLGGITLLVVSLWKDSSAEMNPERDLQT